MGVQGCRGDSPLFSKKQKKRALETLAVVSPEGYVFAPANLFRDQCMISHVISA